MSKEKRKPKNRGFYGEVLAEAEKVALNEAIGFEGLDEELAILRFKLRDMLANQPENSDRYLKVITAIARLVNVRHTITRDQKKSLKEAITKVFTELAVPLGAKLLIK
jgi:hypothetical protein